MSRLEPQKGLAYLLEALAAVPRVALVVAGAVPALAVPKQVPPGQAKKMCTDREDGVKDISLPVAGETATGRYALPAQAPETLVVFAHGYGHTSDSWAEHMRQHARVTVEDEVIEARAFAFQQPGVALGVGMVTLAETRIDSSIAAMIAGGLSTRVFAKQLKSSSTRGSIQPRYAADAREWGQHGYTDACTHITQGPCQCSRIGNIPIIWEK